MSGRPVTATAWLEIDADDVRYIRVIPRDPWAPMVTARWRPRWSWARTWRHRERVRFGAWEERPSSGPSLRGEYNLYVHCSRIWAQNFHDAYEAARRIWAETPPALAALARSGVGAGAGEGPADSGGSQTYKRGDA